VTRQQITNADVEDFTFCFNFIFKLGFKPKLPLQWHTNTSWVQPVA